MKIFLAAGIYPPQIGGPAQYAFNLATELRHLGHEVAVAKFSEVKDYPTGIRHLIFFLKVLPLAYRSDCCLALDTFSVAVPTFFAAKIFRTKFIIRAGGDFLWEQYVERTGNPILFRNFYQTGLAGFDFRERLVFKLLKFIFKHCDCLVFNSQWQRDIWRGPYGLDLAKTRVVENFYGAKESALPPLRKNFVAATRPLKWKNLDLLKEIFAELKNEGLDIILDLENLPYDRFLGKIKSCYAVILVSLGDISPNFILDALRYDKPIILTAETGLKDKLADYVLWVDPLNREQIKNQIRWLVSGDNYQLARKKIAGFNFTHPWRALASEFAAIMQLK